MATILQIRRGTTDITLADGEMYLQKDTNTLQISNGSNNPITLLPLNSDIEGNIILTGNITASNAYFTGDVAISGNLFLGNNSSDNINALGVFTSDIKPGATNTYNIGSSTTQWAILYTNVVSASYISGSLIGIGNVQQFSASVNQRLVGVELFSASLNLSLDGLLYASTSVSSSVLYLNNFTSSQTTKNLTLSTYTSSIDSKFTNIGISTSSLNTFTGSTNSKLLSLEQKSSSVDNNITNIHSYTSSLKNAIEISGQDLVVYGNLTVQGTQTSLNVGQVYIEDLALTLASGAVNSAAANGAGFNIAGANVSMSWDSANSRMNLNKPIYFTGEISASTIIGLNGAAVSDYSTSVASRHSNIEQYTASISSSIKNINSYTASSNISISNLNTYTASVSNSVYNLNTTSASLNISISNLNNYSASVSNSILNINNYTASVSNSVFNINNYSASVSNSLFNINNYTASVSKSILSINDYTSSVSNSVYWINIHTSSINNFSSSDYGSFKYNTNLHLLEIDSQIQYLSPEGGAAQVSSLVSTASVHENRLNEISQKTGSYELKGSGIYSSSTQIVGVLSSLNSYSSSNDSKFSTLASVTASLYTYTSSQDTKNLSLASYTGSINSKFASIESITSSLISATSSYETKGRGIVSGSSQIPSLLPVGTVSGSSQILGILTELNSYTSSLKTAISVAGSDVTVNGNLTVLGTTTNINSTQVNIGENIIELNFGGVATTAGIYTKDATGGSTTSGSLLWDSTNDIWIAGKRGSEAKILTDGLGVVSGSSQIVSVLSALNTYTASQDNKNTTLSAITSSLISKTGSYATTGSNVFVGNTVISGSLEVSASFTASLQQGYVLVGDSFGKTKAVTTASLATLLPNGLLSSSNTDFSTYTSSIENKFVTLQNVTSSLISVTGSYATTGSNVFVGNITISGSLNVSSSITASLQEGYIFVGNGSNKTSQFATASIAGIVNTSSQTFVGNKTFTDLMEVRGGIRTGGTLHNNLNVPSGSGSYTISGIPDLRLLNVGTTHRIHSRGENDTVAANSSYATFIIGTSTNVENSTGTHPLVSQLAIKPLVLNDGVATTTNAATLYVEGPTSGSATITNNYSIWVHTGSVKIEDNIIVGSITGSIAATNGVVSGSSQIIGVLSSVNNYTSSNDTKWSTLVNVTSSVLLFTSSQENKNNTLASYTSSIDTKWTTLQNVTSSILSFTASQETKDSTLASYTGSIDTKWSTLQNVTSSILQFTSSQDTKNISLLSVTSSLISRTGSYATTGSNVFVGNQLISGSLTLSSSATIELTVTGAVDITGSLSASLNQGYTWVGGSNNRTILVATSSLGGVTSLPSGILSSSTVTFSQYTGSTATTGSNTFIGNQAISGSFIITGSLTNLYNISVINSNTNASASNVYVMTSALTLTLPNAPLSGSWIKLSNLSNSTACILGRNGKKIMNVSEDMTLDDAQASFELIWSGDTYGWVLIGAR